MLAAVEQRHWRVEGEARDEHAATDDTCVVSSQFDNQGDRGDADAAAAVARRHHEEEDAGGGILADGPSIPSATGTRVGTPPASPGTARVAVYGTDTGSAIAAASR